MHDDRMREERKDLSKSFDFFNSVISMHILNVFVNTISRLNSTYFIQFSSSSFLLEHNFVMYSSLSR